MFVEFLQNIRRMGLEYFKVYYGHYPAYVTNVNDPGKRGRIKVKCPSLFGDVELADWVIPLDQRMAGEDTGEFLPPYEKTWVTVVFEYGRPNMPRYFHGGYWATGKSPEDFSKGYLPFLGPQVKGWIFKSGQKILIDETKAKEKITLINTDKSQLVMDTTIGSPALQYKSAKETKITVDDKSKTSVKVETKSGALVSLTDNGEDAILLKTQSGAIIQINKSGGIEVKNGKGDQSLTINEGKTEVIVGSEKVSVEAGKMTISSTGQVTVEAKGAIKVSGSEVEIAAKTSMKVAGKATNVFGDGSGMTDVKGQVVKLAEGSTPVAKVGSTAIGLGNMGSPVVSQIQIGSFKVLVP